MDETPIPQDVPGARPKYNVGDKLDNNGTIYKVIYTDRVPEGHILVQSNAGKVLAVHPEHAKDVSVDLPASHLVRGLREMADFLEKNPAIEEAANLYDSTHWGSVHFCTYTKEEFIAIAKHFGASNKKVSDYDFELRKDFSGKVSMHVNCSREKVCKKVVTGTKQVEKLVRRGDLNPAEEAIASSLYTKQVVEEEVTEWQCEPGVVLADVPAIVGGAEDATK